MADKYIYIYRHTDGWRLWTSQPPACESFPEFNFYHPSDKKLVYEKYAKKDWIKRLRFLEKS